MSLSPQHYIMHKSHGWCLELYDNTRHAAKGCMGGGSICLAKPEQALKERMEGGEINPSFCYAETSCRVLSE